MRTFVDHKRQKPRDKRWVMRCDEMGCPAASEAFQTQPNLDIFRARGWFIAEKFGDKCPACVERTATA